METRFSASIKVKSIEQLNEIETLVGDERIPISADHFVTTQQIADLSVPHFVVTDDEVFALSQRDGKVYIVVPK